MISGIFHKKVISVSINNQNIIINDQSFDKTELNFYDSEFQINISGQEKFLNFVDSFINDNLRKLNPLSMAFLIDPEFEENFNTPFQKAFVKHVKKGWKEITDGNLIRGIKKIKGSGYGLTPAGDDFIAGILYASNLIDKIKKTDTTDIRKSIYETASGDNDISGTMIYHAYIGAYFKQFKDLQISFTNKNIITENVLTDLLEIGETSGSDILVGYILGLKYFNKSKR